MSAFPRKLSVIVPAYNKDSEVFQVVSRLVHQLKTTAYDWEIIVVDDASHDYTLREAVRSKKFNGSTDRIKIYSYNLNQGKGFALYYGFKKSHGDTIAFIDSDLDLPSENITTVLAHLEKENAQIAIGSKRHPDSQVNYPILRRIQSKAYQLLTTLLFNLNVTDTQVGVKAFRKEVLDACFPRIVVKQFAFDVELLVVAKGLGYTRIVEAPIILNYNFSSTIRLRSIYKILVDTAAIFYRKYILHYYNRPTNSLEKEADFLSTQKAYI